MEQIKILLIDIFEKKSLLQAILSSPRKSGDSFRKLTIRPIIIKKTLYYQTTKYEGEKTFHTNLSPDECQTLIQDLLTNHFKQALICLPEVDFHILISKKLQVTILKKPPTQTSSALSLAHNRKKQYVMEERSPIPFLVKLGIMTPSGQVIAKKSDKFKQLNRFLEMIDDILPHLKKDHVIKIIDFGCGKAYLTFALYHYLHTMQGYQVEIQGLDLKEDVIVFCQQLAKELNYNHLKFSVGNIENFNPETKVDMVITLHACDTATDSAIAKAVKWQAEVILCVPCCQKELFTQIRSSDLAPMLHYGIIKERFASLATDAARAHLLEMVGYQTQILEFIDLEHTPKNLLIRAVKRPKGEGARGKAEEYTRFKEALGFNCSLEKFLNFKGQGT